MRARAPLVAIVAAAGVAAMTLAAPPAAAQAEPSLDSETERFSYVLGLNYFRQLKSIGVLPDRFSLETFLQAERDLASGQTPRMTEAEIRATGEELRAWIQERQRKGSAATAGAALAAGTAFLERNAEAPGVVVTASGLQYRIDRQGDGPKPQASDTVETHYAGRLLDGSEFDSSYKRGEPTQFPVNRVIPGWTEALQLMPVGSKWELWIPYDLAYGPRGTRGIPPNSTLNFTVELLGIVE